MTDAEREQGEARIADLQRRIAELRARLPKHSPPTAMLVELDELEDEVARAEGATANTADGAAIRR